MKEGHNTARNLFSGLLGAACLTLAAAVAPPLWAQQGTEPPPVDPELEKPPPLPPKVQDEQIKPTVTIREEDDRRIEEYSVNGQVYMVKVTPEEGPSYYYVDTNGDGLLELDERSRALNPVLPVHWKIAEWK